MLEGLGEPGVGVDGVHLGGGEQRGGGCIASMPWSVSGRAHAIAVQPDIHLALKQAAYDELIQTQGFKAAWGIPNLEWKVVR